MEKHFLPEDVITEILSRLPAQSVLECRRVCKTWRILTYHPSFAHQHLLHSHSLQQLNDVDDDDDGQYYCNNNNHHSWATASASSNKVSFILQYGLGNTKLRQLYYEEYDDDDYERTEEDQSYERVIAKINHHPIENGSEFVGSSNGLICVSVYHNGIKDPIYIFNPITREYVDLPRFTQTSLKGSYYIVSGFGYHPKTNEYKVVRIYYEYCDKPLVGRVQVYTLGSGCGWRNIGEIICRCGISFGVLANGALHWTTNNKGTILSFDLANEEFRLLPSLPCFNDYYQLQVLGGLLCVVHQKEDECVTVWSLKKKDKVTNSKMLKDEASQSWSWILEFNIEWEGICETEFRHRYDPFAFTNIGEVLLWDMGKCLCRYNPKTKILEAVVGYAPTSKYYVIPHVNSFISLRALGEDAKIIESTEGVL